MAGQNGYVVYYYSFPQVSHASTFDKTIDQAWISIEENFVKAPHVFTERWFSEGVFSEYTFSDFYKIPDRLIDIKGRRQWRLG